MARLKKSQECGLKSVSVSSLIKILIKQSSERMRSIESEVEMSRKASVKNRTIERILTSKSKVLESVARRVSSREAEMIFQVTMRFYQKVQNFSD